MREEERVQGEHVLGMVDENVLPDLAGEQEVVVGEGDHCRILTLFSSLKSKELIYQYLFLVFSFIVSIGQQQEGDLAINQVMMRMNEMRSFRKRVFWLDARSKQTLKIYEIALEIMMNLKFNIPSGNEELLYVLFSSKNFILFFQ